MGDTGETIRGKVVIDYDDERSSWRFRCPRGHASAEPTNNHWWCSKCARLAEQGADIEPEFEEIEDRKEDRRLARDEVELRGARAV